MIFLQRLSEISKSRKNFISNDSNEQIELGKTLFPRQKMESAIQAKVEEKLYFQLPYGKGK